jgi:Ni/Co efflux regulator RcnB
MRLVLIALAAAMLHLSAPAAAQSPTRQSDGRITSDEMIAGVISEIERRTIGRYYKGDRYEDYEEEYGHSKGKKGKKGKNKGLPPGLAKRDRLPPGLQKHLDERGVLPPGLAKRDLPPDLHSALPRRINEEFRIVDDDVVLIERATGVVLDVLENVTRGGRGG